MKYLLSYQRWLTVTILITFYAISVSEAGFACVSNPCVYGICIDDLNSTYTCYCIDGYTGIQCQTNWDECWSSPCLNGGSCIDGVASYNCSCAEGFQGENCEHDIDECNSSPCLNGICVDIRNGYECQCFAGYSGINCEIDLAVCNITNEARCHNNGICIDGPGLKYTCQCQPGWTGKRCESAINECLSSPCLNGAVCLDLHANYACACTFGYSGHNCEIELELCDLNLCENSALCLVEHEIRVCYCVPDYHGDRCQYQYDECQLKGRCTNGGTCIDGVDSYTCSCPDGTSGPNCECSEKIDGEYECSAVLQTDNYDTSTSFQATTFPYRSTARRYPQITRIYPRTTSQIYKPVFTQSVSQPSTTTEIITDITEAETEMQTILTPKMTEETEVNVISSLSTTKSFPHTHITTEKMMVTTKYENTEETFSYSESDMSTFDTTYEQSTEGEFFKTTRQIKYDHSKAETQADTIFDWTELARTTETTFVDEYWNVTRFFTDSTVSSLCQNTICLNGGTCYITSEMPKCVCRFGWEGAECENMVNIKVVAFTGKSYLMHHLNNGTSTIIALKVKTLSTIGVLFYAQITSNMYMYLYVQDGFLKFQFSCGVQTMLFSETKYRINSGYETSILATVTFNINLQNEEGECDAALRINNTVAMSGEQTTATEQKVLNMPMLYIGGFPKYLLQQLDLPVSVGIIGCMHSLQVDSTHRDIYADAFDGYEISECSSLACISNPCHASATCIEQGHSWTCVCPSGYIGRTCNVSICDNNPCQFGATCVQYPTNGFLCLCPLGKHGLYCEHDLEISQPTFSSTIRGYSSFVAYRLPVNSVLHTFELRLKFIAETMEQISLMLFIGQEDKRNLHTDYMSLSFIKGYIALTWNLGAGPRRIFTPRPIMKKGKKMHSIKIGRTGSRAWLFVDGFKNITGRSLARHTQLNVTPIIYVGGYESFNFADLPHDLPLHSGFAGCIYDMELHTSHIVLGLQKTHPITGRSVAQCGTSECSNFTCQHGGVCLQYGAAHSCLCPDGWFGPICAYRYNLCDTNLHKCADGSTCVPLATNYECDCPVGQTGKYCEKNESQLSDVYFSGQRSYLLHLISGPFHTKQFSFDFEAKPLSDKSLILYAVESESSFFASILIKGGILEFRVLTFGINKKSEIDNDIISVKSGTIISTGEWTKIRAGRFGQKLYLSVNGITNSRVMLPDNNVMLNNLKIYFGGTENLANIPNRVTSGLPESYYGCVRKFDLNYKHISLTEKTINSGRNIADCDGTPCGADVCVNGGTCWLNATLEPYCMCPQEYQGDRCEHQVSCDLAPCKNGGQCVFQNNNLVCHCPLGWVGLFCEEEMPSVTPFLKGNSYIIVDKKSPPPTKKRRSFINNTLSTEFIYIKFSTTYDNGLLLWNTRADQFFGIGIDDGNLKIVWSVGKSINQFAVNSNVTINNGIWHSVVFRFNQTFITVTVDEEEMYIEDLTSNDLLKIDDLFYIGGFPDKEVFNQTHGIFSSNFCGCIEEFGWNEQMVINNFKRYKGENIGSCFEYRGSY